MKNKLVILGAGGHAKVVLDAVLSEGKWEVIGFCVDDIVVGSKIFDQYKVLDDASLSHKQIDFTTFFVVAVGDNMHRKRLYDNAALKFSPAVIVHATAFVSASASIGKGTVVLAKAVVNAGSYIGENSIVSTGVLIDHDCSIGNNSHLAIGTVVASKVTLPHNFLSDPAAVLTSFAINQ